MSEEISIPCVLKGRNSICQNRMTEEQINEMITVDTLFTNYMGFMKGSEHIEMLNITYTKLLIGNETFSGACSMKLKSLRPVLTNNIEKIIGKYRTSSRYYFKQN